jgi:hypothetical protein
MRTIRHILLLGAVLCATSAAAFDFAGFHSGMTLEQAKSVAAKAGYVARAAPEVDGGYYFLRQNNGELEIGYSMAFCSGKLGWLSVALSPRTFETLADTLSEMSASLGTPTATESAQSTHDGRLRTISFHFPAHNGQSEGISATAMGADNGVTVSRLFKDAAICPKTVV